ncbi:MAG: DapH/DapD/GlmU-related protein [Pseudomonadota bacterium]
MAEPSRRSIEMRDVRFGEGVTIVDPVNLYDCEIGDDCFIGPFVEIQQGVRIGVGCRIQSHTFLCEGVRLGARCFIAHGVMFVNDLFKTDEPARGDRSLWGETIVGDDVSIGSGAVVLPVAICARTVIGAGAVVTKSISKPGVYAGNPAKWLRGLKA